MKSLSYEFFDEEIIEVAGNAFFECVFFNCKFTGYGGTFTNCKFQKINAFTPLHKSFYIGCLFSGI